MNFFGVGHFQPIFGDESQFTMSGSQKNFILRLFVGNELIISKYIMFLRSSIQNSTQGGKLKKKIRETFF